MDSPSNKGFQNFSSTFKQSLRGSPTAKGGFSPFGQSPILKRVKETNIGTPRKSVNFMAAVSRLLLGRDKKRIAAPSKMVHDNVSTGYFPIELETIDISALSCHFIYEETKTATEPENSCEQPFWFWEPPHQESLEFGLELFKEEAVIDEIIEEVWARVSKKIDERYSKSRIGWLSIDYFHFFINPVTALLVSSEPPPESEPEHLDNSHLEPEPCKAERWARNQVKMTSKVKTETRIKTQKSVVFESGLKESLEEMAALKQRKHKEGQEFLFSTEPDIMPVPFDSETFFFNWEDEVEIRRQEKMGKIAEGETEKLRKEKVIEGRKKKEKKLWTEALQKMKNTNGKITSDYNGNPIHVNPRKLIKPIGEPIDVFKIDSKLADQEADDILSPSSSFRGSSKSKGGLEGSTSKRLRLWQDSIKESFSKGNSKENMGEKSTVRRAEEDEEVLSQTFAPPSSFPAFQPSPGIVIHEGQKTKGNPLKTEKETLTIDQLNRPGPFKIDKECWNRLKEIQANEHVKIQEFKRKVEEHREKDQEIATNRMNRSMRKISMVPSNRGVEFSGPKPSQYMSHLSSFDMKSIRSDQITKTNTNLAPPVTPIIRKRKIEKVLEILPKKEITRKGFEAKFSDDSLRTLTKINIESYRKAEMLYQDKQIIRVHRGTSQEGNQSNRSFSRNNLKIKTGRSASPTPSRREKLTQIDTFNKGLIVTKPPKGQEDQKTDANEAKFKRVPKMKQRQLLGLVSPPRIRGSILRTLEAQLGGGKPRAAPKIGKTMGHGDFFNKNEMPVYTRYSRSNKNTSSINKELDFNMSFNQDEINVVD